MPGDENLEHTLLAALAMSSRNLPARSGGNLLEEATSSGGSSRLSSLHTRSRGREGSALIGAIHWEGLATG
jgi:hypothetical protein